jgi:hypothetical protein
MLYPLTHIAWLLLVLLLPNCGEKQFVFPGWHPPAITRPSNSGHIYRLSQGPSGFL